MNVQFKMNKEKILEKIAEMKEFIKGIKTTDDEKVKKDKNIQNMIVRLEQYLKELSNGLCIGNSSSSPSEIEEIQNVNIIKQLDRAKALRQKEIKRDIAGLMQRVFSIYSQLKLRIQDLREDEKQSGKEEEEK